MVLLKVIVCSLWVNPLWRNTLPATIMEVDNPDTPLGIRKIVFQADMPSTSMLVFLVLLEVIL